MKKRKPYFKREDIVDEIGRGVLTRTCKLCGLHINEIPKHLEWHNRLDAVLKHLLAGDRS